MHAVVESQHAARVPGHGWTPHVGVATFYVYFSKTTMMHTDTHIQVGVVMLKLNPNKLLGFLDMVGHHMLECHHCMCSFTKAQ